MKLIALTGLPRSGKDTVAERLVKKYGYARRAFAEPLKAAAAILLGREVWEMEGQHGFDREAILPEWGFTTRWFLQMFGTECLREQIQYDFWLRRLGNSIAGLDRAVITDCRFENEATFVHSLGGTIVQVWRPGVVGSAHVSDAGVIADSTLHNDKGVIELWDKIDEWVQQHGLA